MPPSKKVEGRSLAYLWLIFGLFTLVGALIALTWARSERGLVAQYYAPYALLKSPDALKSQSIKSGEHGPGLSYRRTGKSKAETTVTKLQRTLTGGKGTRHTWNGYFLAPEKGTYVFELAGRQRSSLVLDGVEVLGMSAKGRLGKAENAVALEKGAHALRLTLKGSKKSPRQSLALSWKGPSGQSGSVDGKHFKYAKNGPAKSAYDRQIRQPDLPQDASLLPSQPFHQSYLSNASVVAGRILGEPYRKNWDFGSFRFPAHFYDATVYMHGQVELLGGDDERFFLDTAGWAQVWIDGEPLFKSKTISKRVSQPKVWEQGVYDFTLAYRGEAKQALSFGLKGAEGSTPMAASRFSLLPDELKRRQQSRGPPAYALFVLSGLFFVAAFRGLRHEETSLFDMAFSLWELRSAVGLSLLVLLGALLRFYDYTLIPAWGETMDEYANAWNGWNIWHGNGPRAWSPFSIAYGDVDRVLWMDNWFSLSEPYVDRPPLFAVILGLFLTLTGTPDFFAVDLATMRLLPIVFSLLSIPLVFLVAKRLYGEGVAWLATLLFVVSPIIIWTQRLAKSESLLALLWILGVWLSLKGVEQFKHRQSWKLYFIGAVLAAGLAPWCKEVGIVAIPVLAWIWWRGGLRSQGLTLFVVGGLMAVAYPIYGTLIAGDVFWAVVGLQGHKKTAFDVGFELLTVGKATYLTLDGGGGFMLFLWFAAAATLGEKERLPHGAVGLYLVLLAPLVATKAIYGWYRLPIYPFLVILAALFLRDLWRRPNILAGGLFLLTFHWMTLIHLQSLGVEPSHDLLRGMAVALILGLLPAQLLGGRAALYLARFTVSAQVVAFLGLSFLQLYYQVAAYRV